MLDEQEYAEAFRLYGECMTGAKEFRLRSDVPLADSNPRQRFAPLRAWHERLSGFPDCHENAIMHHRLADFGEPCRACGKPLRTPRAKRCAACGSPRE